MALGQSRRRRKALGQHFLIDGRVADRQIRSADLQPDDVVLEIGPGPGALTRRIAPHVRRLITVEKDAELVRRLRAEFAAQPGVEIHHADATKLDWKELGPFNKAVSNLPYSVSTPITFRLLPEPWTLAVLMYQEEFARRLVAEVGQKAYGRLSAARAYYATAEIAETVPPTAFQPPPKVRSAVVRLRRHRTPPFEVADETLYLELLRVVFSTRRKTLRSTLRHQRKTLGVPDGDTLERLVEAWGRGADRPERVSPADFGRFTFLLAEARGHG